MIRFCMRCCWMLILASLTALTGNLIAEESPEPPIAKKIPKKLTVHDHTRVDNYYWLNQRDNQEVIDYLNAENNYLKTVMEHTEPLQEMLFEEIKGRLKPDESSVPYLKDGYYYISPV